MFSKLIKDELRKNSNPDLSKVYLRFFKTGKGEYGEGDKFFGIKVPEIRKIAKKYPLVPFTEINKLLNDPYHEARFIALIILVEQFKKGDGKKKKEIFNYFIKNSKKINNWDLVDVTSPKIVGEYLLEKKKERNILYTLAKSKNLWQKRISIISTYTFIKNKQFDDTLKISLILLKDKHDLIHKAVGWMLREIGKIDQSLEENFLKRYYKTMPRTMLRYAIERFDEKKRQFYLKK